MKTKLFCLVLGIILIASLFFVSFQLNKWGDKMEESEQQDSKVFLGPVPIGYDEEHFRKTGETKPLEDKE